MEANKLMIGDWVLINGVPKKIQAVDGVDDEIMADDEIYCLAEDRYHSEDKVTGIPLTPEILEKNGFVKIQATVISTWNCSVDRMYSMSIDINRETGNISGHFRSDVNRVRLFCPVNHVHDLQHALRLCRIEKEIEL